MMTHKTNVVFHIVPERERGTNENVTLSYSTWGKKKKGTGYYFFLITLGL